MCKREREVSSLNYFLSNRRLGTKQRLEDGGGFDGHKAEAAVFISAAGLDSLRLSHCLEDAICPVWQVRVRLEPILTPPPAQKIKLHTTKKWFQVGFNRNHRRFSQEACIVYFLWVFGEKNLSCSSISTEKYEYNESKGASRTAHFKHCLSESRYTINNKYLNGHDTLKVTQLYIHNRNNGTPVNRGHRQIRTRSV